MSETPSFVEKKKGKLISIFSIVLGGLSVAPLSLNVLAIPGLLLGLFALIKKQGMLAIVGIVLSAAGIAMNPALGLVDGGILCKFDPSKCEQQLKEIANAPTPEQNTAAEQPAANEPDALDQAIALNNACSANPADCAASIIKSFKCSINELEIPCNQVSTKLAELASDNTKVCKLNNKQIECDKYAEEARNELTTMMQSNVAVDPMKPVPLDENPGAATTSELPAMEAPPVPPVDMGEVPAEVPAETPAEAPAAEPAQ